MTSRIRVDDDAADVVDELHKKLGGTKSGLASEAIRRGAEEMLENYKNDNPD